METEQTSTVPVISHQKLLSLGILWPAEVDRICAHATSTRFLIDGFLPAKSIAIVAGDSAIGKSPLICQLALCLAAGVPFIGMEVSQGRVLYCDMENSLADCKYMRDALAQFLGLDKIPDDFLLVTEPKELEGLAGEVRPALIVVDSLRAYRPDVTDKNRHAGEWIMQIRKMVRKYDCAFLVVHHLKKPSEAVFGHCLDEECRVATWLLQMEGPRALVNQTDVRIAVEGGDSNPAALKLKWSRRVHGDSSLVLLERVCDENGEPAGYHRLMGVDLLSPERRVALEKLSAEFSFKEARIAFGRSDDPTNKFLGACRQLGLVEKLARGRYRKAPADGGKGRASSVSPEATCLEGDTPLPIG